MASANIPTTRPTKRPKKCSPTSTPGPKTSPPPNIPTKCEPKKIADTFSDNYVEYISDEGGEELSVEEYLENIRPICMI